MFQIDRNTSVSSCHRESSSARCVNPLRRALLATAIAGAVLSPSAFALNYEVSNTNDAGSGSLRDALDQANATLGVADTITFAATVTGTISLTSGPLYATDEVEILGPGADQLTIDGSGLIAAPVQSENRGRGGPGGVILAVIGASQQTPAVTTGVPAAPNLPVTLSGVTLTGAPSSAVAAKYAELTINDAVITGNGSFTQQDTPAGGAIFSTYSALTLNRSQITNNTAKYGGGIFQAGDASTIIDQSTIAGNRSYGGGGAIIIGSSVSITSSTVSGNVAQASTLPQAPPYAQCGGLIVGTKYGIPAEVANSTISNNQAGMGGGVCAFGAVELSFVTVAENSSTVSGGGLIGPPAQQPIALQSLFAEDRITGAPPLTISVRNSVIAGNSAPANPDIAPNQAVVTLAFTLVSDISGAVITDGGGNIFGQPAQLGPLADNGGPTMTHAPLAGSPLIDAGDPAFTGPPTTDQRGQARVVDGVVDMGAIEAQAVIGVPSTSIPVPGLGDLGKWALGILLGLFGLGVARRRTLS